jgi:hypothetical protein
METLKFSIQVNASREKVWDALWNKEHYEKWTAAFSEGSHAVSDWKEGSKILFLDGEGQGMFSIIDKKIPSRQMSFKHLGVVIKGVEQPADEKTKDWSGAKENYYLSDRNGGTELKVEMDTVEEHAQYFRDVFPKALEIVKQAAEN